MQEGVQQENEDDEEEEDEEEKEGDEEKHGAAVAQKNTYINYDSQFLAGCIYHDLLLPTLLKCAFVLHLRLAAIRLGLAARSTS